MAYYFIRCLEGDVNGYPKAYYKSQKLTYQFQRELSTIKRTISQRFKSFLAVILCSELNHSTTTATSFFILEDVNSNDVSGSSHMIFEVFPLSFVAEIREIDSTTFHTSLIFFKVFLKEHFAANHFTLSKLIRIVVPIRLTF